MRRTQHIAAVALPILVLYACFLLPSVVVAAEAKKSNETHNKEGQASPGRLVGVVTDSDGAPLEATLVSATGPAGVSVALCDSNGRFEFRRLRPGSYLVRAHLSGFAAAQRHIVEVRSGLPSVHTVALHRAPFDVPVFLAAGFGPIGGPGLVNEPGVGSQPDGTLLSDADDPDIDDTAADGGGVAPHDDSEKAWRLRRARRSVLKDSVLDGHGGDDRGPYDGFIPVIAADRRSLYDTPGVFPVTGQVHLLMRAQIQSTSDLMSTRVLPGQIAYISLGGVERQNPWGLRGAVRTGDAGSWVLAGNYLATLSEAHHVAVGLSYSRQNLEAAATPLALTPSLPGVDDDGGPRTIREAGSLSVKGRWDALPQVVIDYGANVARYGYLPEEALMSPNAVLTVSPVRRTRVRVAVAQHMLAPGAEEFLPPSEGVWLPPERTFALLAPTDPLSAEQSRHIEVSAEHDIGRGTTIGVRRFRQEVDDQMVAMFGVRPQLPVSPSDHYYLASTGNVTADGWGVMWNLALGDRVRSSVDYSLTNAEWAPWSASGLTPQTVGVFRAGTERNPRCDDFCRSGDTGDLYRDFRSLSPQHWVRREERRHRGTRTGSGRPFRLAGQAVAPVFSD